jgi:hypothetical protein
MIVSWKFELRKSLRENRLLSLSNFKLDRWIMFLILHRFMGVINDLEISHRLIELDNFLIQGDKSGEPQTDILDDDLLLLLSLSIFMTFNDLRATSVWTVECFLSGYFCKILVLPLKAMKTIRNIQIQIYFLTCVIAIDHRHN